MSIEKYIPLHILNNEYKSYKDHINDFYIQHQNEFIYGQKRDNCGVIAASFVTYMKNKNIHLLRVSGEFITDIGSYTKLDFYKNELIEMEHNQLDPNSLEDRIKFCDLLNLHERQKKIPHYWNQDESGLIIDLSGYSQFVKTGLSINLNSNKYLPENKFIQIHKIKP